MNMITNNSGLSSSMAVWLAHDEYTDGGDLFPGKDVISVTSLIKPTRQFILGKRATPEEYTPDVVDMIRSRIGHALHDSIEAAWKDPRAAMMRLGYPKSIIDRIKINPTEVSDEDIPVYLEQRYFREIDINGHPVVISGKFDQIIDGEVNDTKSTSVYTYINGSKADDYALQGSMYRWISPDKVTSDVMRIQHIFTDWQRSMARADPKYPQQPLVEFTVELMSLEATEAWIRRKILEILANQGLDEPDIIPCSQKDLWMSDPLYKYYSDPAKAAEGGRSNKNFPNYPAAAAHLNKMGKGVIVTVEAEPKACGYCAGFAGCTQKDQYDFKS